MFVVGMCKQQVHPGNHCRDLGVVLGYCSSASARTNTLFFFFFLFSADFASTLCCLPNFPLSDQSGALTDFLYIPRGLIVPEQVVHSQDL